MDFRDRGYPHGIERDIQGSGCRNGGPDWLAPRDAETDTRVEGSPHAKTAQTNQVKGIGHLHAESPERIDFRDVMHLQDVRNVIRDTPIAWPGRYLRKRYYVRLVKVEIALPTAWRAAGASPAIRKGQTACTNDLTDSRRCHAKLGAAGLLDRFDQPGGFPILEEETRRYRRRPTHAGAEDPKVDTASVGERLEREEVECPPTRWDQHQTDKDDATGTQPATDGGMHHRWDSFCA
jgi:hypothetical protein